MKTSCATSAAIYCRISRDTEGEALGVARQEEDCRALAARLGLDIVGVYVDNDIGASTRSRAKPRPQYGGLLADARAGQFGAILAYSNSRLTRRPMEFEDLVALHEKHAVRIATVVSGEDDLGTADGRMVARIKGNVDAAEAERTGERVARKHLESARAGKPVGGTRPFGWEDDKVTVRPGEAELIRRAVADVIAGVPLRRIAEDWNGQGSTTSRGSRWSGGQVRQLLRSPRLAGWRVHRPTGSKWTAVPSVAYDAAGAPVRGLWEPILDDATWRAAVAALTSPETRARVPRKGARHYLLTGILRCGRCNSPMYGNRIGETHYYRCVDHGHVNSASGHAVDIIVSELLLRHLAAIDLDRPTPTFAGERRLEQIAGQVAELMDSFVAGHLTGAVVFPAVKKLETERDALARQRDAVDAAALGPDLAQVDEAAWEAMDTDRRRAVAEKLLDAVLIRPTTRRTGNRFDAERIEVVWKVG